MPEERDLAFFCLEAVRREGGVLEHPYPSLFWKEAQLPPAGLSDGRGFSMVVDQFLFGFPARKRTWLYVVGLRPGDVPGYPLRLGQASKLVEKMTGDERSRSTREFAEWLVAIARLSAHT